MRAIFFAGVDGNGVPSKENLPRVSCSLSVLFSSPVRHAYRLKTELVPDVIHGLVALTSRSLLWRKEVFLKRWSVYAG